MAESMVVAAAEEEVRLEVEAVRAVYAEDCEVIKDFPPHLSVHITPRTGDDSSQQFVEVVLGVQANVQYPEEPPHIYIIESKGLEENRQTYLITSIKKKAEELSSSLMLVTLFEKAVEILTNMNHPDGNCPLCLYPLLTEEASSDLVPFMKLMSCYHCFHRKCIVGWWKWLQKQILENETMSTVAADTKRGQRGTNSNIIQEKANCPVCRKIFDVKDIKHVLDYLGTDLSELNIEGPDFDDDNKLFLQSATEISRRQNFEALMKLQKENSGLIEPRKSLSITPGMYLAAPVTSSATTNSIGDQSGTSLDSNSDQTVNEVTSSNHEDSNLRKQKFHGSRRKRYAPSRKKEWIRKEPNSQNGF